MLEGIKNNAFNLKEGGVIILPEGFKTRGSNNRKTFPETPRVLIAWKERDDTRCHFDLSPDIYRYVKKILVFISEKAKAGDSLKILWIEGNCACTALISA
jgi:hypothetical protein